MQTRGFTLIEVMITVAIVAILPAVAYPSYQNYVVKTRRKTAEACLVEYGQFMERYYTTNMKYTGATLPTTQCRTDLASYYTFDVGSGPSDTSYTLKAEAQGVQAEKDASCTPLKLAHTGAKSPSACWD